MDQLLINKFKLNELHYLEGDACLEALQFLNYLLARTHDDDEKTEINAYLELANRRCKELNLIK